MFRELWWMVADLFQRKEPDLFINLRRVNQEDCRIRRLGLEDDVDYRDRVKKRMTEGAKCDLPPLYSSSTKKRRKRIKLVSFRKKAGNGAA